MEAAKKQFKTPDYVGCLGGVVFFNFVFVCFAGRLYDV